MKRYQNIPDSSGPSPEVVGASGAYDELGAQSLLVGYAYTAAVSLNPY